MAKRKLENVTLLGIDCLDVARLRLAVDICQEDFEFAETKILTSLDANDKKDVFKINSLNSTEDYSRFVITDLWRYVSTDYVLLVQHDGFILNPAAWTDTYLDYDYIGAPWLVGEWSVDNFSFPRGLLGKSIVGNGGFSLRSKKILELTSELAQEGKMENMHPEDVSICVWHRALLEDRGIKFAPVELAKKFSFEAESMDHCSWDSQFGFHGLRWTDISAWTKVHPGHVIDNPGANKDERAKWLS